VSIFLFLNHDPIGGTGAREVGVEIRCHVEGRSEERY
jgi:hypothetical protein